MTVELPGKDGDGGRGGRSWTFLTNHARVLIYIAGNSRARVRDIAGEIGITERSAQGIVRDLEEGGYVKRNRIGRRNRYTVTADRPFRHPTDAGHAVAELLAVFLSREQIEQDDDEVIAQFGTEPPPAP
jgi:DNA-binding MarR family transcriptional regulator